MKRAIITVAHVLLFHKAFANSVTLSIHHFLNLKILDLSWGKNINLM